MRQETFKLKITEDMTFPKQEQFLIEQEVLSNEIFQEATLIQENKAIKDGKSFKKVLVDILSKFIKLIGKIIGWIAAFIATTFNEVRARFRQYMREFKMEKARKVTFIQREFIWKKEQLPTIGIFNNLFKTLDSDISGPQIVEQTSIVIDKLDSLKRSKPEKGISFTFRIADYFDMINEQDILLNNISDKLKVIKKAYENNQKELRSLDDINVIRMNELNEESYQLKTLDKTLMILLKDSNKAFADHTAAFTLAVDSSATF